MKKKTARGPSVPVDPTKPFTEITVGGVKYRMCFELGALAEAESAMVAKGYPVNLLVALPRLNLTNTRILFAASLHYYHPEIAFEDAISLLGLPDLIAVSHAVIAEWEKSSPEKSSEPNPTPAAP